MSAAEPLPLDPFSSAADPARYVPRAATIQALAELRAALAEGPGAIAFTGPAGIGKSLLMAVLASEAAWDYTFVRLQATPPGAEQVCESALHALGDGAVTDPAGALALRAGLLARRGRPLVLLLDSVEALPAGAREDLAELPTTVLRCVLVASEREDVERALRAFGPRLRRVRLSAALSRAETEEYLQARLEAAHAPAELRVRLLGMALDLWRRSRGNPQCLHAEISQVQFELWRAGGAEPRLHLLEEQQPEDPDPAPGGELTGLGDLEVGAVEPVAEATSPPVPVVLSIEPVARTPRKLERLERCSTFALGVFSGALATAAVVLALHFHGPVRPGGSVERAPAPAAPALPPVAAAPQPEASSPPAPAAPKVQPPPPVEAVVEPPPPAPPAEPREVGAAPPPAPVRSAPLRARPAELVRVQVQAQPWATIYVDGKLVGETPLGDLPVQPGLREFRAEMPDGRKLSKRVQVSNGTRVLFQ